jgi:hypothetical protein
MGIPYIWITVHLVQNSSDICGHVRKWLKAQHCPTEKLPKQAFPTNLNVEEKLFTKDINSRL